MESAQEYDKGLHPIDEKLHPELKKWMPWSLSEYQENHPDTANVRKAFEPFYLKLMTQATLLNSFIEKARLIDKDIPHEKRIPKQAEILNQAITHLWKMLEGTIAEMETTWAAAEAAVEAAKRLPEAIITGDIISRCFKMKEIQDHLDKAGAPAAGQLVLDAAKNGRLEVLQAVTDSTWPCLDKAFMDGAYEIYLNAYHKPLIEAAEDAKHFRDCLTNKKFSLDRGIMLLGQSDFK